MEMSLLEAVTGTPNWRAIWNTGGSSSQQDCVGSETQGPSPKALITSTVTCAVSRPTGDKHVNWTGHGDLSGAYWAAVRRNARKRGIEFNLTIDQAWDVFQKQDGKCAFSGVAITMGSRSLQTASLDRIDSVQGYSEDNVQWLHKDVNVMKLDHSTTDFLFWIDAIHNHVIVRNRT